MSSFYSALLASVLSTSTPAHSPAPLLDAPSLRDSDHLVLESVARDTHGLLRQTGLDAELTYRVKSPSSTLAKMRRSGLSYDQVYDRLALRLITDTDDEAYALRDAIESRFQVVDGRSKDYIQSPKANGYQSLHSTVRTPMGDVVEFQVRTRSMHEMAENGTAAHWRYKLAQGQLTADSMA